jgi:hypothetical protein
MAAFNMKISRPREQFEELLQSQEKPPMGFLIACVFELLLDIRELLMGLNMEAGAREGSKSGLILP